MAGMIISSLPFAFHYALLSKEVTTTKYRPEIFLYFGIIIVSIPIFYLFLTTGITAGITCMDMNVISKIFLIVNMILGIFENIAVVYLFIENWKMKTLKPEYLKHLHRPHNKHQDKPAK